MYVILTIDGGIEETDPWKVYKGRTFETLEEAELARKKSGLLKSELSSQIGRVIPLEGDPDFGGLGDDLPSHYDSPDNNAWTRANYGLPPEPGDPEV